MLWNCCEFGQGGSVSKHKPNVMASHRNQHELFFHIDFLVQFWSQTSDRTLAVLETSPMTAICIIEGLQNSTEGGFLTKNSSGFKGRH